MSTSTSPAKEIFKSQCSPDNLKEIIKNKISFLKNILNSFDEKRISTPSSTNIKGTFELSSPSVSNFLQLDQSVCNDLIESFKAVNPSWESQWDNAEELRENFFEHYLDERNAIVEISCYLFYLAIDSGSIYHNVAKEIIEQNFLDDDFIDQIFKQLKRIPEEDIPDNFAQLSFSKIWALQVVKEQKALLELLFLRYTVQEPEKLTNRLLLKFLQHSVNNKFGLIQHVEQYLDAHGKNIATQINHLYQIVMITIMFIELNFRSILQTSENFQYEPVSTDDLIAINNLALNIGYDRTYGVFHWIWSSYLLHLQVYYDETGWPKNNQSLETTVTYMIKECGLKAFKLDVISYILSMLKGPCFQPDVAYLFGYKLAFKLYFISVFEAYEVQHLPKYELLVECFSLVFGENGPSELFWNEDFDYPKRRSLLDLSISRFPHQFHPLMQLFDSLAFGSESANNVYSFMKSFSVCSCFANNNQLEISQTSNNIVISRFPIKIFKNLNQSPVIPQRTEGYIVSSNDEGKLVRWMLEYSGWQLCYGILKSFSTLNIEKINIFNSTSDINDIISKASDILLLINTMFKNNPDIIPTFLEHLESQNMTENYDSNFLSMLFSIIHNLMNVYPIDLNLIASTLQCIKLLLPNCGKQFYTHFKKSRLLPDISIDHECTEGRYPVTLAILDLMIEMLVNLELHNMDNDPDSWKLSLDVIYSTLSYILGVVFVYFELWHYKNPSVRIQIGLKCLEIFNRISLGCHPKRDAPSFADSMIDLKSNKKLDSIREFLIKTFISDEGSYYSVPLISIIEKGKYFIQHSDMASKNLITPELLKLLEYTLELIILIIKGRKIYSKDLSWIELNLLDRTKKNGKTLILKIASLIKFTESYEIPMLACELLTLLLTIADESLTNWQSLGGLFGKESDSKQLLKLFIDNLQSDIFNPDLQVAIINFITVATKSQFMFIINDFDTPKPLDRKGKGKATDENQITTSVSSVILSFFQDWKQLIINKPLLLLSVVRFMDTLWLTIHDQKIYKLKDFKPHLKQLQENKTIWENIVSILFSDIDDTKLPDFSGLNYKDLKFFSLVDDDVLNKCCKLNIIGGVLRIIANEIKIFTKVENIVSVEDIYKKITTESNLKTLFIDIKKSDQLFKWFKVFIDINCDSKSQFALKDLANKISETYPQINLKRFTVLRWSEDYDLRHQYGDSYIYDINLAFNVFLYFNRDANNADKDLVENFLSCLCKVNHQFSQLDSQIVLLRSWRYFMEISSSYLGSQFWISNSGSDFSWPIVKGIAEHIDKEANKENLVALTMLNELATFLFYLLTEFTLIDNYKSIKNKSVKYLELIILLEEAIINVVLPKQNSIETRSNLMYHKPLLQSLLLCLRTLNSNENNNYSQEQLSNFQKSCHPLLTKITALLESAMSRGFGDSNYEEEILILIAIMEQLIKPLCIPDSTKWLKILEGRNINKLFFNTFKYSLMMPWKDRSVYADSVIYFLLHLSNIPSAAKKLFNDGIMTVFCNNQLSPTLQEGKVKPNITEGGEEEDWHQVWCLMLAIVTSMLSTIDGDSTKERKNFLKNLIGFINLFSKQFQKAMALELPISMPYLEEISNITMMFYHISLILKHEPIDHQESLAVYFDESLIMLVSKLNYLFTHPKYMSRVVQCLTEEENKQSKVPISEGLKIAFQKIMPAIDVKTSDSYEMNRFLQRVQQKLLVIARNTLATYINLTKSQDVLMMSAPTSLKERVYFEPLMKISDNESPTIATLLEFMEYGLTLLELWEISANNSDKIDDQDFWKVTWKTNITFIEMTGFLTISQLTTTFFSEQHKRRDINGLLTEVNERIVKILRTLNKLLVMKDKVKAEESELTSLDIVLRGLQKFIPSNLHVVLQDDNIAKAVLYAVKEKMVVDDSATVIQWNSAGVQQCSYKYWL
ncbi:14061_t:CDS:2 [Entrophospora sp. SA101]|nr:14061_t:CDS:2 [Entrophospora sp. SA101]